MTRRRTFVRSPRHAGLARQKSRRRSLIPCLRRVLRGHIPRGCSSAEKRWMTCVRASSCHFSFLSKWPRLGLHGLDEIRRRGTFERKAVANLSHDALLQGLDKMCPRVTARDFRSLQVQRCQFACASEGLTIAHDLGDHPPLVSGLRRHWMWVQQKRFCSSRSSAITPGGEDSIPGNNATRKVGQIIERRTFARHDHVGKRSVLGMHVSAPFDRGDHGDADVAKILENLDTLVVYLAPNLRVSDVAK